MAIIGIRPSTLCWPAYIYLVISVITLLLIALQNYMMGGINTYCIGDFSCNINPIILFVIKIIYVLFWTWILNILCKGGGEIVSWFLVLIPYILFFLIILMYMYSNA